MVCKAVISLIMLNYEGGVSVTENVQPQSSSQFMQ